MVEPPALRDIERRSGIRREPGETVNEYFGREELRAFADEAEIAAVRDVIQRRQFAREVTLGRDERDAIERFDRKLSDYEPPFDTPGNTSSGGRGTDTDGTDDRDGTDETDDRDGTDETDSTDGTGETDGTDESEAASETPQTASAATDRSGEGEPGTSSGRASSDAVVANSEGDATASRSDPTTYRHRGVLPTVRERYRELRDTALGAPRRTRAVLLALLVLLAVPVGVANATYSPAGRGAPVGDPAAIDTAETNVTFIAAQGTETGFGPGIFAYDDEGELVWQHNRYFRKYFDVDPIGDDRVLLIAQKHRWRNESAGYPWVAAVYNWRTDTLVREFPVPPVTHDVDYMGGDTFIAANLQSHRKSEHHDDFVRVARDRGWIAEDRENFSHNLYQLNLSTGEIEWEYRFKRHFPRSAGEGYSKGYTHLNDVDVVDNGTAVLASPRNFDRVVLIDKATKELRWTLGEEDNYDVLYEQHNPALLRVNPPVVLVADSENRRVVEYQRLPNGTWARTWGFEPLDLADSSGFGTRDLSWPRDADRFPNGNTLITASAGGHVLEVTPDREVVWSVSEIEKVYEAERLRYGDEPRGPPMTELRDVDPSVRNGNAAPEASGGPLSVFGEYYYLASWVIPAWVTQSAFYSLHGLLIVGLVWGRFEWLVRRRSGS